METSKNENPHKITINDQEFQKVGEMKSEPTGLKHAPKNYDLYQDTESGTLAGKLPEYHPSEKLYFEKKIKDLPIDLSKLSPNEIRWLITNKSVKIYGEVVGTVRTKNGAYILVDYVSLGDNELEVITEGHPTFGGYNYYVQIKDYEDDCKVRIDKSPEISYSKNLISIRDTHGSKATFSFYEMPEEYKLLMEKKKASE